MKKIFSARCAISGKDHFEDVQKYCELFITQSHKAQQSSGAIFKARGINGTTVERKFYECGEPEIAY